MRHFESVFTSPSLLITSLFSIFLLNLHKKSSHTAVESNVLPCAPRYQGVLGTKSSLHTTQPINIIYGLSNSTGIHFPFELSLNSTRTIPRSKVNCKLLCLVGFAASIPVRQSSSRTRKNHFPPNRFLVP